MFEQKTRRLLHMLQPCEASQYGLHISDFCHKFRLLYQTTIACTSLHSIYLMNLELAFSFLDLSTSGRKNLSQSLYCPSLFQVNQFERVSSNSLIA